jgi:hypothetical protein
MRRRSACLDIDRVDGPKEQNDVRRIERSCVNADNNFVRRRLRYGHLLEPEL